MPISIMARLRRRTGAALSSSTIRVSRYATRSMRRVSGVCSRRSSSREAGVVDQLDRQGLRRAVDGRLGPGVDPVGQVHQPAPVALRVHGLEHDLEPDQDRGDGPGRDGLEEILGVAAHALGRGPLPRQRIGVELAALLEPGQASGHSGGGWSSRVAAAQWRPAPAASRDVAGDEERRPRRGGPPPATP